MDTAHPPVEDNGGLIEKARMWDRIPGWAKIGLAAAAVMVVVHIALGVRIWYGIQDPLEVAAIKAPGRHIIIPETNKTFRNPIDWLEALPIGLRGASAEDVTAVRLDEQTTDELIAHIAEHFPKVHSLYFSGGSITTKGLMALKNCPELYSLDVSDTDVDDGLAELLPHLPKLTTLMVMNTNVGDAFTIAAAQHDKLEYCPIEGTNITPAAVDVWKTARPKTRIQTDFGRVAIRGIIRWADGETSRKFNGKYSVGRHGPQMTDGSGRYARSSTMSSAKLRPDQLRWSGVEFQNEADGTYQYRLKLGEIEAKPAEFMITAGKPSVDRIEFQMPVTRAEAEQSVLAPRQ